MTFDFPEGADPPYLPVPNHQTHERDRYYYIYSTNMLQSPP
ncbi:hypothetical protein [Nostoc sp.]